MNVLSPTFYVEVLAHAQTLEVLWLAVFVAE